MADFLAQYSIQRWLESCAQGYLTDTVYGHEPGESEPEALFDDEDQLEAVIRTTVQLVVGERCVLSASSGLVNAAPDHESKRFLATQTLDEARHVEIFTQRLYDLGVKRDDLEDTIGRYANPNLIRFAEVLLNRLADLGIDDPEGEIERRANPALLEFRGELLDLVDAGDWPAAVFAQNVVLETLEYTVLQFHAHNTDPATSEVL